MSYIISSGWWCDGSGQHAGSLCNSSDNIIRKEEFFDLWYYSIDKYTDPKKIIIIDSNSPVKPFIADDPRIEWVSLIKNFGI